MTLYKVGIDIGSTTAKIVALDPSGKPVYTNYVRHQARVKDCIADFCSDLRRVAGDSLLSISVTGSVGMGVSERCNLPFVQEVVAAANYVRCAHPEAKTMIDIGGEDAKVVFFDGGRATDLRMNGNCAGGTGAFIDQMAILLHAGNDELNALALRSTQVYPMASRCGVFSKTDIQNLIARNVPREDIAASIFHAVAVQTVTTLAHGCVITPPVMFCGGPLTFLSGLRKAFSDYLGFAENEIVLPENGSIIPAWGAALAENGMQTSAREFEQLVSSALSLKVHSYLSLPPIFEGKEDYEHWRKNLGGNALRRVAPGKGNQEAFIGIDSGSTTTKVVALSPEGNLLFSYYHNNDGDPIGTVEKGLELLKKECEKHETNLKISGSCSTGYGEDLIRAAFGLGGGIIETIAHYLAAKNISPEVSFILDIGGQDMKAIFVDNGAVTRMELNEACSSGCGTFIQTFAKGLGYKIDDFAKAACHADKPCDLGTRCTVFMNSKVKQVMREGATVEDIAAGLSYSVVRNCLFKVLKLHGNDNLGARIVVQGGTMKNDSVVRAFEMLTGKEVARSNMPEMMGAYGCALHSIADHAANDARDNRSVDDLLDMSEYDTKLLNCKGCENHCFVTRYLFAGGRKFYSGNKCERVFNNKGKNDAKGDNIYTYKYHLLFDRCEKDNDDTSRKEKTVVAIPRILNMYEDFPFWHALFTTAGFKVMLSAESNFHRYESALGTVMSDNICFPAKLVHSHVKELDERLATLPNHRKFIFMPYVVFERQDDDRNINSYNCPIVSAYSDVIKSAMNLRAEVVAPVINFRDEKLLARQLDKFLKGYGIGAKKRKEAFDAAVKAQNEYVEAMSEKAKQILAESRRQHNLTILLAGRPYHTDPLIQHKLSDLIASLGVNVISDDIVRNDTRTGTGDTYLVRQWAYMNRIIKSGQWCATQPDDVHFIQMTSFGCGPDSFIQDEIRHIMSVHGKPYTLLKIDDVSNVGSLRLRVRSLIESLNGKTGKGKRPGLGTGDKRAKEAASVRPQNKKILAPYFTEYLTPLLPPLCKLLGWDVEVLPPSDITSAELGLKYANNEVCYPATLIVGDFVKALRSGKYNPEEISAVMTQTGGQCRATNYAALIRRAMNANGFKDVPLITLGVSASASDDKEQDGELNVPWLKMAPIIVTTFIYGDTISKLYHGSVSRLKKDAMLVGGQFGNKAEMLREKYLTAAAKPILDNDPKGLMSLIARAAKDFDDITEDKELPAVGIVGEIFLKFNPFAHQFLERRIINNGCEVVPPLLLPFFLQEFVNTIVQKHMGLKCSHVPDFLVKSVYSLIWRREEKVNRIASRFRYFRPFTNIFDEAKEVNGVVSLAAQFGEGWLLPSDIISMVKQGVNNVASLQPFGCIANHIVSKGIEKKLKAMFPQLNLVSLDFDSGVSAVNVTNRLLLFLDSIA